MRNAFARRWYESCRIGSRRRLIRSGVGALVPNEDGARAHLDTRR